MKNSEKTIPMARYLSSTPKEDPPPNQPAGEEHVAPDDETTPGVNSQSGEASRPGGPPSLRESVHSLSDMVAELKSQLIHQIRLNEAQEADLAESQRQMTELNRVREGLLQKIEKLEEDSLSMAHLKIEVDHLRRERERLVDRLEELRDDLVRSEDHVQEVGDLLNKLRTERNDASEEAVHLEVQLERAMKVVEELRRELVVRNQRQQELEECVQKTKQHLDDAIVNRDAYRSQLDESHEAFEALRQSILTSCQETRCPIRAQLAEE